MTTSHVWSNNDGDAGWDAVRAMSGQQRAVIFQRREYLCKRMGRHSDKLINGKKSFIPSRLTPAEAHELRCLRPVVARLHHIIKEAPAPNKPLQKPQEYRTIQLPASNQNLSW